jgi:LacI family transcriptional regulator
MGYQPDPALQALIAYRRQARPRKDVPPLAYVTNWETRMGWKHVAAHGEFFLGAEAKAHELGYGLEHFWLGEPKLTHQRMSDILSARGITGVIIASHKYEVDAALRFDWPRFSAVKIDFFPHEPTLHNVTNDQRAIIRLAMRRVITAGYRRIGFVMHRGWDEGVDLAWSAGYLAEEFVLEPDERIPILRAPPPAGSPNELLVPRALFEPWFRQYRPEVLISYGPFVRPHLEAMGLSVPRDVAFVDILLESSDGRIAGVRQNSRRVGEVAVEILAGQLQQHTFGIPKYPTATLVEGTWMDGESLPVRTGVRQASAQVVST